MTRFLLVKALLFVCILSFSQQTDSENKPIIRCATDLYIENLKADYPEFENNRATIEKEIQQWIAANEEYLDKSKNIITIPVVVHMLYYQDHPAFNLPDSRVFEQLEVLNKDFRRLNVDATQTPSAFTSAAADSQIEFCLAQRKPDGTYSNGIVRKQTHVTQFNIGNAMMYDAQGGSNAWDRNKYLNIWVCNLGGGILGFAQPPGGPAATDGVVIHYRNFGVSGASAPYNKGRTATHEVGHWLNLHHIWGDDATGACTGSDYCNDTPNQADPYYGCPPFPQASCGSQDMFMNYMDYTDDGCMNIFTNNQKTRMWATLNGFRNAIRTSNGCQLGQGMSINKLNYTQINISIYPNPTNNNIQIIFELPEYQDVKISLLNSIGQMVFEETHENIHNYNEFFNLETLSKGIYYLKVSSKKYNTVKKIVLY